MKNILGKLFSLTLLIFFWISIVAASVFLISWTAKQCSAFGSKPTPIKIDPIPATQVKSLFPVQAWTDHALKEVQNSELVSVTPKDGFLFCPQGMSAENWVHLLASMAKYESDFIPDKTYRENFRNSRGEWVISTGLLQLSYESVAGYGFRVTTEDLKDPFLNLTISVKILEKWVTRDGVITSGGSPYRGGARYWSVLRSSGKLKEVKATLKNLCQ